MLHRVGVVVSGHSLASKGGFAASVIAFGIWSEIVYVPAEFDRIGLGHYVFALAVKALPNFVECPLREGSHVVRIAELGNPCLHRRLKTDRKAWIAVLENVPEVLAFAALVARLGV